MRSVWGLGLGVLGLGVPWSEDTLNSTQKSWVHFTHSIYQHMYVYTSLS